MATERISTYVVDSSVVLRWHLLNPPFVAEALKVKSDFQAGRIPFMAPDNFRYEFGGGIRRAVSMRRISRSQGEQHISEFNSYDIPVFDSSELLLPICQLSIRYGAGFYDAFYLHLAERFNVPFLHADANLSGALVGRFPLERWIEDY